MNRFYFGRNRKMKGYEYFLSFLLNFGLCLFPTIFVTFLPFIEDQYIPTFSIIVLIFYIIYLVYGIGTSTIMSLLIDKEFYDIENRKKRFIFTNIVLTIILIVLGIVFMLFINGYIN